MATYRNKMIVEKERDASRWWETGGEQLFNNLSFGCLGQYYYAAATTCNKQKERGGGTNQVNVHSLDGLMNGCRKEEERR